MTWSISVAAASSCTTPSLSPRKVPRARRSVTVTSQTMPIVNERDQLSFQSCSSGVLTASCGMKLTTAMDESALDVVVTAWCPTQNPLLPAGWQKTRRSVSWRLHTMRCRVLEGRNHFPHVRKEGHDVAAETTSASVMLAREKLARKV